MKLHVHVYMCMYVQHISHNIFDNINKLTNQGINNMPIAYIIKNSTRYYKSA